MKVKLDPGAFVPERAHETDAGYDLKTPICVSVPAHGSAVIDTGVHIELPHGKCAVVISKSGLYIKRDITTTGLVDEGYNGSIRVGVQNHGNQPYVFARGDKVSQFFITDYYTEELELVDELSDSERGEAGFGSTGK